MFFRKNISRSLGVIFIFFLLPAMIFAEIKTWTGYGGDSNWLNVLNWSGTRLPASTDDVLFDNGDLPLSYQVFLPNVAVVIRTLHISPSAGRNIELILPATNLMNDAFSVMGPGYGIELNAGAIFRNASGISSGESLHIADSIQIHDGGRYIHQTRASHASSILKFLSTAPGTEQGVFEFDVPRASYTISVSNRTYGSLELQSTAYGASVNYTCTGSNPLLIRGNLRIGSNVRMSMDLTGINGNIQVEGDFIQEGGVFNLASGMGSNTVLRVKGDLYQSAQASITETNNGMPFLELNGTRQQQIAMAGTLIKQIGFRMNNDAGAILQRPLVLPWKLELIRGPISSSAAALLTLDVLAGVSVDSTRLRGTYVDGPLRKLGLNHELYFLFPVGKQGNLRWLELKNATGNFTVEYQRANPAEIGMLADPVLDHISKIEYWNLAADATGGQAAQVELSFASVQSGGVTNPNFLNVAAFQSANWFNAGHAAFTGNFIQGSVLSLNTDFAASAYTLASTVNLENPLPMAELQLQVKLIGGSQLFSWAIQSPRKPDHFDLYEEKAGQPERIAQIPAIGRTDLYQWERKHTGKKGRHFFWVRMIDADGNSYSSPAALLNEEPDGSLECSWITSPEQPGIGRLSIWSAKSQVLKYEIISTNGTRLKKGTVLLPRGNSFLDAGTETLPVGLYIFHAIDDYGNVYRFKFIRNR